jgi:hypothetical protein
MGEERADGIPASKSSYAGKDLIMVYRPWISHPQLARYETIPSAIQLQPSTPKQIREPCYGLTRFSVSSSPRLWFCDG